MLRLFFLLLICGCGSNAFLSISPLAPNVEAVHYLERRNPTKAKEVLLSALGTQYKSLVDSIDANTDLEAMQTSLHSEMLDLMSKTKTTNIPNLVSLLASAQAQLYDIDPLDIALALATPQSAGLVSTTSNELVALFPILPDATANNVLGLQIALTIINSIGSDLRSDADSFKQALLLTASTALIIKSIDTDGNGVISPTEAANLTDTEAANVLTQLATAALSISASGAVSSGGANSQSSANAVTALQEKIAAQPGDTDADKLRSYLGASG